MNNFKFAVPFMLLVLVGTVVFAQEIPSESRKGKEHRYRKAGGTQMDANMGDGSVRFKPKVGGTQSAASNVQAGGTHGIHGGWDQTKASGTVAGTDASGTSTSTTNLKAGAHSKTGKRGAALKSKHPGGAN
jgi:hypothetical protein